MSEEKKIKVTKCPPGAAEGAYFQSHQFNRRLGRSTSEWIRNTNPTPTETPREITLEESFSITAMSLRELMAEGEE
jgi:hypothetical protein